MPPNVPGQGGGSKKYVLIGLVLLALAGAMIVSMSGGDAAEAPKTAEKPAIENIERSTSLAAEEVYIPDEEELEEPEPAETAKTPVKSAPSRDRWDCGGELEGASAIVQRNSRQVRACYERGLKQNHMLQGKVGLRMRVSKDGSVDAVQVGGSLRDREVFSCIRNLAKSWKFAAPTGGRCAVLDVPYNFTPRQ